MADAGLLSDTDPRPAGTRFACRVEYDGRRFCGWQSQPRQQGAAVQDQVEGALSEVAASAVRVHCAGRTDAGVHAVGQIIHFDAPSPRSPRNWILGANAGLPEDIRLHWAQPVPEGFHARFSALSRSYRYLVANTAVRPALGAGQLSWYRYPLDEARMHRAAQSLLGEQDFSAFRAAACQSHTPMREVQAVAVARRGELVVLEIRANAFLHHMVRNIAGSLMAIGSGRRDQSWLAELLRGRDRSRAADTAPPDGLYLAEVAYPAEFALPGTPPGPVTLGMH